jgi:SAM-dependent methyltransferase
MQTHATEWWKSDGGFFGEDYMEADASLKTFFAGKSDLADRTSKEVTGVLRLCGLSAGDRVLDCPCGYGRHSNDLASRGVRVVGFDINTKFLKLARERSPQTSGDIQFVQGDMRELPELGKFDGVINMFYSFGFFTPEEDLRVLQNFYAALRPGGSFLMHTMVTLPAFRSGRVPAEERRSLQSGATLISRRRLNQDNLREEGEWTIVDSSGQSRALAPYDVRIYGAEEFAALCRSAGFAGVQLYGDWDGTPYHEDAPYLIAVATK